jgi:uncharacterized protein YggT (Ycf19 family)
MSHAIHLMFLVYTLLIAVRIIGSWFPEIAVQSWMGMVGQVTDPYLGLFRRFLPPLGGVLDVSPIVAFLVLQLLESLCRSIFS